MEQLISTQPSAGQANPKQPSIRSSCNACADAKVGCTKEKPVCSRCARRREQCVYAMTRRAGRRPRNKDTSADDSAVLQSSSASTFQPQAYASRPGLPLLAPAGKPFSPRQDESYGTVSTEAASDASLLAMYDCDIDGFLASHSTFPSLDQLSRDLPPQMMHEDSAMTMDSRASSISIGFQTERDFLSPDLFSPNSYDSSELSFSDPVFSALVSPATTPTTPMNWSPSNTGPHNSRSGSISSPQFEMPIMRNYSDSIQLPDQTNDPCGCRASGQTLLNCLSPPNLDDTSARSGSSSGVPPDLGAVMAQNERAIDTVSEILRCGYQHDESLLFILSLIALKILGWYAAVATNARRERNDMPLDASASQRIQSLSPPSVGNPPTGAARQHYDRAICQLVLSKTHNVQRIVNSLSQQLLAAEQKARQVGSPSGAGVPHELLFNGAMFQTSTTTHGMARGLDAILRSRMRELSQALMNRLLEP